MAYSDAEPITNIYILKSEFSRLITDLAVENILPGVLPFLSRDEQDKIEGAGTQSERSLLLIGCLIHRTACQSYEAFNVFFKILAGIQPDLFTELVGRPPTSSEFDFCIREHSKEMKRIIKDTGHKIDDEEIDVDTQYIQLYFTHQRPCWEQYLYADEDSLLQKYQQHLLEVKNTEENVDACNLLSSKEDCVERVLMSGQAGVGKTTSLQWLAHKWALDRWATGFPFLFLLQLRMFSNMDTNISAIELLTLYGLFQLTTEGSQQVMCSWLKRAAGSVVILMDGLNEIARFSQKFNTCPQITDLNEKAHPISLIMNILYGSLLPGCTLICTSRSFEGLRSLCTDMEFKFLSLTQKQVVRYVEQKHPQHAEYIMSVLKRNPMLMSVCGITFYCMAVSTLLSQGVEISDKDVQTYTRLTAFIIVQYLTHKTSEWPFVIQVSSYFSKLAHLAGQGIVQSKENWCILKLVFNEYDLREVGLTQSDLKALKEGGILHIKEVKTGKRNGILAEFLHSTLQEMLAVAHLLSKPLPTEKMLGDIFSNNQFNMARMYLYGLQYDTNSDWIKDICRAVSQYGLCADREHYSQISEFLTKLCIGPENKLLVCQLVHESQMEDLARSVVDYVAPDGVFEIQGTPMTAIDVLAVSFVCYHSHNLKQMTFKRVHADDSFMKVLSSSLIRFHISSLELLDITDNLRITADGVEALAKAIHQSQCLKMLNVSKNAIGDDGTKAIAEALKINKSLRTLQLNSNGICADGAASLSEALIHNHTLQKLCISGNFIGVNGVRTLGEALHTNNSLHVLDVSYNFIGDDGVKALGEALHVNKSLKNMNLRGNRIGAEGVVSLSEALVNNHTLQELDVSLNGIDGDGTKALAKALQINKTLKALHLSINDIGDDGTGSLSEALVHNHTLQGLDVSCNSITPNGARALGKALHMNNSLRVLNVSGNGIDDHGAKALAKALHANTALKTLDLDINQIGADGAVSLFKALVHNHTLQELKMSDNIMRDVGAMALAEALHTNNSLQVLNISENCIGVDGAKALAEALHTNNSLQQLNISDNCIGYDGEKALAEVLHTNNSLQVLNMSKHWP